MFSNLTFAENSVFDYPQLLVLLGKFMDEDLIAKLEKSVEFEQEAY